MAATPSSSKRETAARAFVWTLMESFGLSGLSIIALIVLSRYVGPVEFGLASVALAVVQMGVVIVERLFQDPLIQRRELTSREIATAFSATLALGLLLTLACWLAAPWLSRLIGQPDVTPLLRWMSLGILAASLSSVLIALHRREFAFRPLAQRSLLARAAAAVVAIALAMWGAGVWSIVAQQVLATMLSAIALWCLSSVARPRLGWNCKAAREMLRLGGPATLQQFLWTANARMFIVLAGAQVDAFALGQIALAFRVVDMMRDMLAQAVAQLALPLFSRIEREDGDRRTAFIAAVRLTSTVMLPVFTLLAVLAPEVVEVAFGDQWRAAAPFVSMLALLSFHFFPRMFVTPMLSALGRPAATMFGSLAQTVFIVVFLLLIVPEPSPFMVMAVWAARLLVSTPIDMWFLKRLSGIGYVDQWRGAFSPAIACAVTAAMLEGSRLVGLSPAGAWTQLALMATAGSLIYVLALWIIDRPLLIEVRDMAYMSILRRRKATQ